MKVTEARFRGAGLVRDAQGKPKIDNIYGVPLEIWRLLTEQEQDEVKGNGGYPSSDGHP